MELASKSIIMVCPPAEELSVIINNVKCEECGLSFRNEPRLRMHVLKIHERKNLEKIVVKENIRYHCPENSCVYSPKSQRYFTQMKYLKQHYLKVHAAKTFACSVSQCEKSFSTEAARQAHLRVCGVQFTCGRCLRIFGTYEALLTHAKRTNHSIDEKYKSALLKLRSKTPPLIQTPVQRSHRPISILPRSFSLREKVSFDVAVQTEENIIKNRQKSPSKACKRRESRQTQTSALSKEKGHKKTVETQTIQASRVSPPDTKRQPRKTGNSRKTKGTFARVDLAFADNLSNEHLFANSPLQLQHDVGLQDCFWEEKNPSLGTQTNPEKDLLEALNDSVTQTELVSFYSQEHDHRHQSSCLDLDAKNPNAERVNRLAYAEENALNPEAGCYSFGATNNSGITRADPMLTVQTFPDKFSSIETQTEAYSSSHATFFDSDSALSRSFALSSNTETQTTENFPNIEQLLYSNTCTQTCNDILPSDLGLSDIQTQTAWPELEDGTLSSSASGAASSLLTSTETQTRDSSCRANPCNNMSSCRSWFLNNRTSHTETQTDLLSMFDEFQ